LKLIYKISILILILSSITNAVSKLTRDLEPYSGKVIDRIEIIRKNVFDDQLTTKSLFFYRWANEIHFLTSENVIRRELLFKEGDSLNVEKVIETERNLRLGSFIGEININLVPDTLGGVEMIITTTDLWTTKASLYADLAGGKYNAGLSFVEENLLGMGKMIQLSGQIGNDQDGYQFIYFDRRVGGTRQALDLEYSNFTFMKGFLISLTRPQYSLSVPYAYSFVMSTYYTRPRLFNKGQEIFRYRQKQQLYSIEGLRTVGRFARAGLALGYVYHKYDFSQDRPDLPLDGIIPPNEIFSYPVIGLQGSVIQFGMERFLDGPGTPEDLTYGASLKVSYGQSLKALGANFIGNYNAVSAKFLTKPHGNLFVGGSDRVLWWNRDGRKERIEHRSEGAIYYKPATTQLIAVHALTDFAWRQRSTFQFFLGGGTGLRGHSYYELTGDKLALGNLEYRFYLPIEILTIRLGGTVFYDIGNVWKRGEPIKLSELKSDAGIGLRFGFTKSSTSRVISLDLGRSLSRQGVYVSFGTAYLFDIKFMDHAD
jgi:hypothetical protein